MGLLPKDQNQKPRLTGFLAGGLFLLLGFGVFVSSAKAQLPLPVPLPTQDYLTELNTYWTAQNTQGLLALQTGEKIKGGFWEHLKLAGAMGIHTMVANFVQQLSMDFATDIAEAGSGKQPLLFGQPFEQYLTGLSLQAVADFIGEVSKPFESVFGFSLCEPSLNFRLGFILPVIKARFEPPRHRCEWKKLVSNWQEFGGSFGSDKELLEHISLGFTPGGNDIGVFLAVNDKLDLKLQKELFAKIQDRVEGDGWKAVADVVTGNIKTPAQIVKEEYAGFKQTTGEVWAGHVTRSYMSALANPEFWIATAVSPFFNTLLAKSSQRLLQKGLLSLIPEEEIELGALGGSGAGGGRTTAGGTAGFRQEIAGIATPITLTTYDPISEMVSCPPEPSRQPNNCVMDNGLASALRLAQTGKALTLACALDPACARQEFLHGDWPLLGPEQERHPCVEGAYCYSNLVKMRQLRILPLGFEIAALNSGRQLMSRLGSPRFASRDTAQVLRLAQAVPVGNPVMGTVVPAAPSDAISDRPVTLKEVLDNFNNPSSLYYHLIDPNWIIKFPLTRCDAKVYGTSLVAQGSASRAQVCVDTPSCIEQDSRGNCLGWGHCLREKNVWKFPGESCPAQFASCLTLTDSRGKQASYLWDTMERCAVVAAGCNWYSTRQASDGSRWLDLENQGIWQNRLYLKNAERLQCAKEQEGCSQFKVANAGDTYFKEAPDYYHCEDYTKELTSARYALTNSERVTNCTGDGFLWRDDIQRCVGREASPSGNLQCPAGTSPKLAGTTLRCISKPSADCARFARACTATEVGCLSYTPVTNAGPAVPGKITRRDGANWKDECPGECVGYNRYTAVKQFWDVRFDNEGIVLPPTTVYNQDFIPAQTRQCQAADVGCSEFTNLEAGSTAEQKVYFKQWKSCIKPGPEAATFYTWEGSDTQGFQLKAWSLKKLSTGRPALQGSVGDTFDPTCRSRSNFAGNPDCREFFDATGRSYFASAKNTITASADCSTFRKTAVDETNDGAVNADDCPSGAWSNGVCLVSFIAKAGEAVSCSAPAAFCREYRGTNSTNVRTILQDTFEGAPADLDGWSATSDGTAAISNSAIHVGDYSLALTSNVTTSGTAKVWLQKPLASAGVQSRRFYEVSFWARADQALNAPVAGFGFSNTGLTAVGSAPGLAQEWRPYRFLGQAPTFSASNEVLTFGVQGINGNRVYFDNIVLKEVTQSVTVIQGSWQIPASCTAVSLTGRGDNVNMFGCAAYKQGNETINLRSFTNLCSEQALDCQAYTKTFNYTGGDQGITFNGNNDNPQVGKSDNVVISRHETKYRVVSRETSCTAPNKGCRALGAPLAVTAPLESNLQNLVTKMSVPYCFLGQTCTEQAGCSCTPDKSAHLTNFTANDPGPSCLVVNGEDSCLLPFKTIYVKDNPDSYLGDGLLCQIEEDRCESYTYRNGQNQTVQAAAKKPSGRLCEWRDGVLVNGVSQSGWFIKGTDVPCPASSSLEHAATVTESSYRGFVAACAPEHNLCTQFVDPRSPASPYYVISSNQLDRSSCQGQVSEKFGCIPFVDNSNQDLQGNVTLSINSALSFKDSTANEYEPVRAVDCSLGSNGQPRDARCGGKFCVFRYGSSEQCQNLDNNGDPAVCDAPGGCSCKLLADTLSRQIAVRLGGENALTCTVVAGATSCTVLPYRQVGGSCTANNDCVVPFVGSGSCEQLTNDANTVLKVDRDRQCGAWLACRSSSTVFDPRTGQQRQVCQQFDLCSQLAPDGSCADGKFVPKLKAGGGLNPDRVNFLDREVYQNRGVTTARSGIAWSDQDFSGYSTYLFDRRSNKQGAYQPYDLEQVNIGTTENPDIRLVYVSPLAADYATCQAGSAVAGATECGTANLVGVKGTCYSGRCVWAADGRKVETQNESAFPKSCRGYPEAEAPFPSELKGGDGRLPNGFDNVKVCEDGEVCDCSYQKATYKGGTAKYFGPTSKAFDGVCQGGPKDGKLCDGPDDKVKCIDPNAEVDSATDKRDTSNDGRCMPKEKIQPFLGWQGYCLQKDRQTRINGNEREFACATWLPLDQAQGSQDLYNQYADAGFNPSSFTNSSNLYCAVKKASQQTNISSPNNPHSRKGYAQNSLSNPYEFTKLQGGLFNFDDNQGWDYGSDILRSEFTVAGVNVLNLESIKIELTNAEADDWPEDGANRILTLKKSNKWQDAWCGGTSDKMPLCLDLVTEGFLESRGDENGRHNWRAKESAPQIFFSQNNKITGAILSRVDDGFCDRGGMPNPEDNQSNLLAVAAWFDQTTGDFKGFYSGICDGSDNDGYIVVRSITLKLRDACEAPVSTVSISGIENQAFTDRLALGSPFSAGNGGVQADVRSPYAAIDRTLNPVGEPIISPQMSKSFGCYEAHGGNCVDKSNPNTFDKAFTDAISEITSFTNGLFRKVYDAWKWSGEQYVTQNEFSGVSYDHTNVDDSSPPQVAQVQRRSGDRLGKLDAITVADRVGGRVSGVKSLDTSISFYAWADRNHLPLRKIEVDFGDGSSRAGQGVTGKYKNAKPYCSTSDSNSTDPLDVARAKVCVAAGQNSLPDLNITCKDDVDCEEVMDVAARCVVPTINIDDEVCPANLSALACTPWNSKGNRPEACDPHFREYFHTYTCSFGNLPTTTCLAGDPGRTIPVTGCKERGTDGKWYCVYKPRAQVKDNWGWCNGGYGGFAASGAPNASCPNVWAEFPGEVRVSAN